MLLLFICIGLGAGLGIWISHDIVIHNREYIFPVLMMAFCGVIVAALASGILTVVAPTICVNPETTSLVHLTSSSSSSYYIGSQYVNQDLTYFYFTKEEDGAIIGHSVRAGLGKIYESAEDAPQVTTYTVEPSFPWRLFMLFPTAQICSVDFKVPSGTVQPSYQVG